MGHSGALCSDFFIQGPNSHPEFPAQSLLSPSQEGVKVVWVELPNLGVRRGGRNEWQEISSESSECFMGANLVPIRKIPLCCDIVRLGWDVHNISLACLAAGAVVNISIKCYIEM